MKAQSSQGRNKIMTEKQFHPDDSADLRRRAEEKARADEAKPQERLSPEEAGCLLHDLQVHQIELELQNEELRRAQGEVEASRARYFDLYNLAPVGYCTVSEKGLILEANLTVASLLGVARGALVQQPLHRFILPEDQDIYYLHRKQFSETGAPQVCELRLLRADAPPFWARLEEVAAQDANGEPVCRAVVSDITEGKRAEEMLRASEQFHHDVLNALGDHIAVLDRDGIIIAVNAAWERFARENGAEHATRTGVGADYLAICRNASEVLAGEAQAAMEGIQAVSRGERLSFSLEYPCHSPQVRRWFLMHATPLSDPNRGQIVSHVDITERKLAEEEHHRLQQELAHVARLSTMGEMVAGIAHEVSQPLHSITTFAKACSNLLSRDEVRLDQLREWNQAIAVAAGRGGAIIKRLRAFLSKSEPQFALTAVREVIEESLSFFAFEIRDRRVTVHAQIYVADLLVRIERIQIQQLLVNLLQNACEALAERTEGEGQVRVGAAVAGEFVEVSVADNGPGLMGCDISKLFDPFFSTKPNGMGMGLGICRTIVEAHGGTIWAVSSPEGGAAFHFTLPVAAEGSSDVP